MQSGVLIIKDGKILRTLKQVLISFVRFFLYIITPINVVIVRKLTFLPVLTNYLDYC